MELASGVGAIEANLFEWVRNAFVRLWAGLCGYLGLGFDKYNILELCFIFSKG